MNTDKFTDQMISREASKLSFEIGALRINSRIANDFGLFNSSNLQYELPDNQAENCCLQEDENDYAVLKKEVRYSHHGIRLIARYKALSDQINELIKSLQVDSRRTSSQKNYPRT